MKKLLIAAAAIAVGGACMAEAIESANVVGYTTVTFAAGDRYVICGIPFDSTTDTEGIDIQSILPTNPFESGWTGGTGAGNADTIQFWVGGQYKDLYLYNSTLTATRFVNQRGKWMNPASVPDASWGTPGAISSLKLKPGMSFWIRRASGTQTESRSLTLSGQVVVSSANATHVVAPGYNLFTSGYSGGFALNNDYINWLTLGAVGGTGAGNADTIQFWVNGQYKDIYLYNSTLTATRFVNQRGKWMNPASVPDASWGTPGAISSKVVQPGEGFWYRHRGEGFTFTENKPYDL